MHHPRSTSRLLDLLPKDVLQRHGIGSELGDTLTQLLDRHLVLVEVEAEESLVVEVVALLKVQRGSLRCVELLGDGFLGVVELLKQFGL